MDTSHEYIDNKTENFDGIIVSEGHETNIPEDGINESITANNSQKKTENSDMKKQSGNADVAVAEQNEKQNESETKRLKDSVKITNFFINEASEIPSYIFIGEHGVAEEILNATKSHERTNPVTDLKPEKSSEGRCVLNKKIVMVQII